MRHLAGDVRLFKILCTRCERTPVLHLTATWQTSHGVEWIGACPCGAHASVTTDGELAEWPTEEDHNIAVWGNANGPTVETTPTPFAGLWNVWASNIFVGSVYRSPRGYLALAAEYDGDVEVGVAESVDVAATLVARAV